MNIEIFDQKITKGNNMRFNYITQEENINQNQLLQVTALAYLEDALAQERYEECAHLITEARKYGAPGRDIQKLITEGARRARFGRPDRPARKQTGARRF